MYFSVNLEWICDGLDGSLLLMVMISGRNVMRIGCDMIRVMCRMWCGE